MSLAIDAATPYKEACSKARKMLFAQARKYHLEKEDLYSLLEVESFAGLSPFQYILHRLHLEEMGEDLYWRAHWGFIHATIDLINGCRSEHTLCSVLKKREQMIFALGPLGVAVIERYIKGKRKELEAGAEAARTALEGVDQ